MFFNCGKISFSTVGEIIMYVNKPLFYIFFFSYYFFLIGNLFFQFLIPFSMAYHLLSSPDVGNKFLCELVVTVRNLGQLEGKKLEISGQSICARFSDLRLKYVWDIWT